MPNRFGHACWKFTRSAFFAACFFSALSGSFSQAMVGGMAPAKSTGESSESECEELKVESHAIRRGHKLVLRIVWSLPSFLTPKDGEVYQRQSFRRPDACSLSGGEHALRNGTGTPLLT
jgi:hypothetical protein